MSLTFHHEDAMSDKEREVMVKALHAIRFATHLLDGFKRELITDQMPETARDLEIKIARLRDTWNAVDHCLYPICVEGE
jgi:hypothetical protein